MTKKEILEKLEKLSPEQKDFILGEIKKQPRRKTENSPAKENIERKSEK